MLSRRRAAQGWLWVGVLLMLCVGLASDSSLAQPPPQPGSADARWAIKTSTPPGSDLKHPHDAPLDKLTGLPNAPGVKNRDSRYTSTDIPAPLDGFHEGEIVRTRGWVHLIASENDGDYHIQVSNDSLSGDHCLIVELPKDAAGFESVPSLRALEKPLRLMLRTKLLHDPHQEPSAGGNWMSGQAYMSITGQLFYDDWHVGDPPRGKSPGGHHMKAATLWEIHPITDIRFAPRPH